MPILNAMLVGAIMVSAWAISMFFWRFWKKTRDGLFIYFAIAFLLLGAERVVMVSFPDGLRLVAYVLRLCAFLLIILAVCDKNMGKKGL